MSIATADLVATLLLQVFPSHPGHKTAAGYGWTIEPLPAVGLLVIMIVYTLLVIAAHRRRTPASLVRILLFAAGLATIAVALFSPIDPYGEEHSPAVHMIQHEMLLMIAPLLMVAGLEQRLVMPISRLLLRPIRSARPAARLWRGVLSTVGNPWFAAGIWSLVTLGWHLPVMYDLSLSNRTVHNIEHMSLMAAGTLFWVVLVGRLPSVHHTTTRERIGALAVAMAVGGIIGAAFIWWPGLLYSGYLYARPWFGLSPWDDQRLAGLIMMIVDMPLLLGATLMIAGHWARRDIRPPHGFSLAETNNAMTATTTSDTTRSTHHHA